MATDPSGKKTVTGLVVGVMFSKTDVSDMAMKCPVDPVSALAKCLFCGDRCFGKSVINFTFSVTPSPTNQLALRPLLDPPWGFFPVAASTCPVAGR
jgi:hypothetical protein